MDVRQSLTVTLGTSPTVPTFDTLQGQESPTDWFYQVLTGHRLDRAMANLADPQEQTQTTGLNIFDMFEQFLMKLCHIVGLDSIIREMWATGWGPETKNLQAKIRATSSSSKITRPKQVE